MNPAETTVRTPSSEAASRIILVTGGGRSGKSSYAQRLAEALPAPRVYVATATPFDAELEERVAKHRESRRAGGWTATLEEPLALSRAIREAPAAATILVDCLTMWVGNLMWAAEQAAAGEAAGDPSAAADRGAGAAGTTRDAGDRPAPTGAAPPPAGAGAPARAGEAIAHPSAGSGPAAPTEEGVAALCAEIVAAARGRGGDFVFVTNEVGMGIIPGDPATRLYRDLLGRCNQVMAAAADSVVLMVSGLPLVLRGRDPWEATGGGDGAPADTRDGAS